MGGAITTNSTFDGRDVSVDGTKLDTIEVSATADQTDVEIRAAVESASDSNVFTNADHNKLDGIEASADVTDATNVTAAGALMDSEVTNLAQVKAFDSSDYATAAQGTTANAALPKAGGTMTGLLTAGAKLKLTDLGNATVAALQLTDSGLGISSPSTDQMNFITADTTRMVIDADGNVGIGTDSPAHKLSIEGGAATVIQMAHGSSAVHNWALAAQYITTNAFEIVPSTVVGGSVFTTPVATFKSTGNVGIGTTAPTYKLETKDGDISVVKLEAAAGGNAVNGIRFRVLNSANTAQSATLGMINAETVNSWGGVLTFSTKPANATPNEAVTERMRIDAAGKVGIGTTNPPAEGLTIRREGSGKQTLLQLDRPNTAGLQTNIKFSVADIMVGQIQHEYASANYNHMSFTLRSVGGADIIPLWLENSGNVGIGTQTPDFKLDIEGSGTPTLAVRNSSTSSNSQIHIGEQNTTAYGVDIRYEGNLGNVFFDNHYAHATRPHMYFRMQTAGTAINALTINPVGNVGIGTGVPTATLDVAGTALVENAKLKAIAESNTDTAVDVFVYDTRKDSDGGAWRKRTQNTSWYNEASGSNRSSRKEFPSVAVLAFNTSQELFIYDGDDPDLPIWAKYTNFTQDAGGFASITAINGSIYGAQASNV